MSGGGSRERSNSREQQNPSTLSLAPIGVAQAFGLGTAAIPPSTTGGIGGGLTITGNNQILPQLFNSSTFAPISDLANPQQSYLAGNNPNFYSDLGAQSAQTLSNVLPGINELATTGFGDAISQLAGFNFRNEVAPELEEQFGAQLGLDTGDADLRSALLREGQRTSFEAANAATQNRILGLQMAQQAPATVAQTAGQTELGLQQAYRQGTPAGQLFDLFQAFTGVDTQGQTAGTARTKSKGDSANLAGPYS